MLVPANVHMHIHAYVHTNKHLHAHTHTHKIEFSLDYTVDRLLLHCCAKLPNAKELSSVPGLIYNVWDVKSIIVSSKIYTIIPIKEVMESHTDVGESTPLMPNINSIAM